MATMTKAKDKVVEELHVTQIEMGHVEFWLLGKTPLIYNAMSAKAKGSLLYPEKKSRANRDLVLKHDPIEEYRDSVYRRRDGETGPTRLTIPTTMVKGAIANVATRVPGSSKTEIGQMVWIEGTNTDVFGVPEMLMSVVRSAGIDRTPDIRTRAILPRWACRIGVSYVQPRLSAPTVGSLLASAGIMMGVGDYRPQKGKGNYGQFEIVDDDDAELQAIMKLGGITQQDSALKNPSMYDQETQELWDWFQGELSRRRDNTETGTKPAKTKKK